jgi:mono/diheme cytochrome c family protein
MSEIKGRVQRGRAGPTGRSTVEFSTQEFSTQEFSTQEFARQSARQSDHQPAEEREIIVSRVRRFSPWILGLLAATPLVPAAGQNLDAGKPASQIFAEVCANCHRNPRELKTNPGASFLREHYTTGPEMAATMAAYLSAGSDPRAGAIAGGPPSRRLPPAGIPTANPPGGTAATRESPAAEPPLREPPLREPRRAQQAAEPKSLPSAATRGHPVSARAEAAKPEVTAKPDNTIEAKPPGATAPPRPALEEFEE